MQYSKYFSKTPETNQKYVNCHNLHTHDFSSHYNHYKIILVGSRGTGRKSLIMHGIKSVDYLHSLVTVDIKQFLLDLELKEHVLFPLTSKQYKTYIADGLLKEMQKMHQSLARQRQAMQKKNTGKITGGYTTFFYMKGVYDLLKRLTQKQANKFQQQIQDGYYFNVSISNVSYISTYNVLCCLTKKELKQVYAKLPTKPAISKRLKATQPAAPSDLANALKGEDTTFIFLRSMTLKQTSRILQSLAKQYKKPISAKTADNIITAVKPVKIANPYKGIITLNIYLKQIAQAKKLGASNKQIKKLAARINEVKIRKEKAHA